jgi:hypothetical protein
MPQHPFLPPPLTPSEIVGTWAAKDTLRSEGRAALHWIGYWTFAPDGHARYDVLVLLEGAVTFPPTPRSYAGTWSVVGDRVVAEVPTFRKQRVREFALIELVSPDRRAQALRSLGGRGVLWWRSAAA